MIIDDIKKANIQAMKDKDGVARGIYSVLINKYMQSTIEARTTGKEVGDTEVVKIIQKTIKELTEEGENYKKVGNAKEVENIEAQKSLLEVYLPKMLEENEIKDIISTLEDKTLPSVMRYFKTHYSGKCDMKLVSEILKNL